jgi:hypothetical protein
MGFEALGDEIDEDGMHFTPMCKLLTRQLNPNVA